MNSSVTPGDALEPPAHPLALALAIALETSGDEKRILLLGIGSGRNVAPLARAGASIDVVEDDLARARDAAVRFSSQTNVRVAHGSYAGPYTFAGAFAAALSTHALLHGRPAEIERAVAAVADRLVAGGAFYATLGSTSDPRFATGTPVDEFVTAPREGSERGVAHVFYDAARLRALFAAFTIDALEEASAAQSAGRWAHDATEAQTMVHWFVRARKRPAATGTSNPTP